MNNEIYLRRRNKIVIDAPRSGDNSGTHLATALKNLEPLGFTFGENLLDVLDKYSDEQIIKVYLDVVPILKKMLGAHVVHRPMYANFPKEVMQMDEAQLYFNAIIHYLTAGRLMPLSDLEQRFPLLDNLNLEVIELGSVEEFENIFTQIVGGNASISEQDKEDIRWFVSEYGGEIARLLPDSIPQKETMAFVAGLFLEYKLNAVPFLQQYCRTATDVLRLTVAMSSGDVSLAANSKFRTFSRPERRMILSLLESRENIVEDMLRWKGRWIRLGEKLHPGEMAKKYPKVNEAFRILRNNIQYQTFNATVETQITRGDTLGALMTLKDRPGELARRLDHLLRVNKNTPVVAVLAQVGDRISTPVLLQVRSHFANRADQHPYRVFFPKGMSSKAYATNNELPNISSDVCDNIVEMCESLLLMRFEKLSSLGKVWVDPALEGYVVPFSQRSASKSLRTIARGSRIPLPAGSTCRFFIWWKNGYDRTDLDLSAMMFDAEFNPAGHIAYFNLKEGFGHHSGDIVDAPEGASEFIDIDIEKAANGGCRYLMMTVMSYTGQPYCDLPECFAGWMMRQYPNSGEIYEPKTVVDKVDLTADMRVAVPLVIDLVTREVIWTDLSVKSMPAFNNIANRFNGLKYAVRSIVEMKKPNLYDLFRLHAEARGDFVENPEEAETIFSAQDGIQYQQEVIASQYLL